MADYFVPELVDGKLHPDVIPDGVGSGEAGKSAYQIAVDGGFVGNEAAWLASLEGPEGPEGPQGPPGADGADSTVPGPPGPPGDTGPAGADGTGVTILGSYPTAGDLTTAHPTGTEGDAYLVAGSLYVWNGTAWENVGNIQGPQGEDGPQGEPGPKGDPGEPGAPGADSTVPGPEGPSAYDLAVTGGFIGTEADWLASLEGPQGPPGDPGVADLDDVPDTATRLALTPAERTKLGAVADGAEVNVQPDWNAAAGDAQILNKPTLGTAAAQDVSAFATATQGAKADEAVRVVAQTLTDTEKAQARTNTGARRADVIDIRDRIPATGDPTTAVQAALEEAISTTTPLYSPPGLALTVGPLTATGTIAMTGEWLLKARDANQTHVLNLSGINSRFDCRLEIDGDNKALYGLRAANIRRSFFADLIVRRNRIWGAQYDKSGNNNLTQARKFTGTNNGTLHTTTATQTAETGNVNSSYSGYGTFTLTTPIPAELLVADGNYFVIQGETAYLVRTLTSTTIEVFNYAVGNGNTTSLGIVIGGALNIPDYGDNGVSQFSSMDIGPNPGIGLHAASLFGHQFDNIVAQNNSIGFACAHRMNQATFNKPYFEFNTVDWVTDTFVMGTVTNPFFLGGLPRMQHIKSRLSGLEVDTRLRVVNETKAPLTTDLVPVANPGSRTLNPGNVYAFHATSAAFAGWQFVINNAADYARLGASTIQIDLSHSGSVHGEPITITLANTGQTIEGGPSFTGAVSSKAVVRLSLVGTDWKVGLFTDQRPATAITAAPTFVGQAAVVGGLGYMAVGTAAAADWKQVTN